MAGKITSFFREYVIMFSIILAIVGFILLFFGITDIWFIDTTKSILSITDDSNVFLHSGPYLLIVGFIVFVTGVWYIYSFLKNRKFVLEELKTNKRSELIKKHAELKSTVKHLPSKYQKMLDEKDEEFNIK